MQRLFFASFVGVSLLLAGSIAAVGWWVDPFAFFTPADRGLDRGPAYTLNRSLFRSVEFGKLGAGLAAERAGLNVLVGDSTSNQIDQAMLGELTGEEWFNFSYGAASLSENIVLIEHLLNEDYPIRRIIWSIAFVRLRHQDKDEMTRSLRMARSPLQHLFTFESLRASWYVLRKAWFGVGFADAQIEVEGERVDYFVYRTRTDLEGVGWPAGILATMDRLERRAAAEGIDFAYAVMPAHPKTHALFAEAFDARYRRYNEFLGGRCTIDLRDRPGGGAWPGELFVDGVHLAAAHRPELTRLFAAGVRRPCATRPVAAGFPWGTVTSRGTVPRWRARAG